jgi:hypothetical protein
LGQRIEVLGKPETLRSAAHVISRPLINGSFAAPGFKTKVVNGRAPELFPVMSLVKKWFARRELEKRRAFDLIGRVFVRR